VVSYFSFTCPFSSYVGVSLRCETFGYQKPSSDRLEAETNKQVVTAATYGVGTVCPWKKKAWDVGTAFALESVTSHVFPCRGTNNECNHLREFHTLPLLTASRSFVFSLCSLCPKAPLSAPTETCLQPLPANVIVIAFFILPAGYNTT
jgi:hypothetical protein